jgi:hypothetical protein
VCVCVCVCAVMSHMCARTRQGEHATNRFAPTVLDALTSSIEHADEDIVFEAMAGLSKVVWM